MIAIGIIPYRLSSDLVMSPCRQKRPGLKQQRNEEGPSSASRRCRRPVTSKVMHRPGNKDEALIRKKKKKKRNRSTKRIGNLEIKDMSISSMHSRTHGRYWSYDYKY